MTNGGCPNCGSPLTIHINYADTWTENQRCLVCKKEFVVELKNCPHCGQERPK